MNVHGPDHWKRVERNARMLAAVTPGAYIYVGDAFAQLHDSMRENEFEDPEHGLRAEQRAYELYADRKLPRISADTIELLAYAIRHHDEGRTTDDPTIGVCWDADRLDLGRVGAVLDPSLFSTEAGKYLAAINRGNA